MTDVRRRRFILLMMATLVAGAAWGFPGIQKPERGRTPFRLLAIDKDCVYAGDSYSWNACRGGQRCARGANDFYYWEDDPTCPTSGENQGGYRVQ